MLKNKIKKKNQLKKVKKNPKSIKLTRKIYNFDNKIVTIS
jgi:hypothetical protein